MELPQDLLARTANPVDLIREDLEDALKEYSALDVLVELLQNAADAIDFRRYAAICGAAGADPALPETVARWNAAITDALEADNVAYVGAVTAAQRATLYADWQKDQSGRPDWGLIRA